MKFSIVIPCYKHPELTSSILMDVFQNCPQVDEVVVVDDFSDDKKTSENYDFWKGVEKRLVLLELGKNVGFLKASNRGLKEATGDIVALISSDVRIKKDIAHLSKEIIGSPNDSILLGGRLLDYDTGWNTFDGKVFPYIEGWALIMTRLGWQELGYFDEQFAPWDFEDVDLSTTAKNGGFELVTFRPWQGDVLEHIGAQSIGYTDERRAITEAHRELFRTKWITKNS